MKTQLSKIISGTMTWGVWGKNLDEKSMIGLMNCCLENKITSFDHADIYGGYTTEASFGIAFANSKIERKQVQFISKCGIQTEARNEIKHYDYSKKHVIWSVENSLRNLKTDYLDILLFHRPSPLMKSDEIAEAIEKLKNDGKIIDFGVSNFTASQSVLIETKTKIDCNQIQFSLTNFEAMNNGSLDYMQSNKIVPMAWNPLGSIFKSNDDKINRIKEIANKLCKKYAVEIDVLCLAWIAKHPAGILPVCGTTDLKRISNLMKATEIEIDLQDWFGLYVASLGTKVA
ncbi:MAG: aldo/keto reductase [Flavobacterium sp.]|nr:aldo/keto reductase [Flavobacterium sp.]